MFLCVAFGFHGHSRAAQEDIAAATNPVEWFSLLPHVATYWKVQAENPKTDQFTIHPAAPIEGSLYRVFVLFPKKSSAYDIAMAQILAVFFEKRLNSVFTVHNFWDDPGKGQAALKYARAQNFDLIYSMGSNSTSFLVEHFASEKTPVVTVCSKDPVLLGQVPDYQTGSGSNIAFTSLDVPIRSQVAYLRQLKEDLKQIAVLYARNNTSAVATQVEPLRDACQRLGIEVIDVAVDDQAKAAEELTVKVPQAVKRMLAEDPDGQNSIFWITGSTSVFREIQTINAGSANIPVLSLVPNVVQAGDDSAVLSIGVSFENNAQIAALYGVRILNQQASPGQLPVGVVTPPDIAINFKKASAIGLKIPFSFFESASFIYDHYGVLVRERGQDVKGFD